MSDANDLSNLSPFHHESLDVSVTGPDSIKLAGTITVRDPFSTIQPFLKEVHVRAMDARLKKLTVDVRELTFVNSSAVRLFVDWAVWLQREPEEKRYVISFWTNRSSTWQRASFPVLRSFAASVVEVI